MELSQKQIILVLILGVAVVLLIVGAVLILSPEEKEPAEPEPMEDSPWESPVPPPTPQSTHTPEPTAFRLPLVPQWEDDEEE